MRTTYSSEELDRDSMTPTRLPFLKEQLFFHSLTKSDEEKPLSLQAGCRWTVWQTPGCRGPRGKSYASSPPTPMAAGAWLVEVATNHLLTGLKDSVTPSNS